MATTTNEKKKPKKERRFHPIRYFREMFGELKKLTWLTGKELVSHTIAVFVFVGTVIGQMVDGDNAAVNFIRRVLDGRK